MRIRSLKPGFFKNEELAELSSWHRLCYAGLWCCADRDGRLQDRPKRLKAEIFPYDDLNMDLLLWDLARAGFIRRYVVEHQPLIDVPSFADHQHPRQDEVASRLASYQPGSDRTTSTVDSTTYPASRPIETGPSLPSVERVASQRVVTGVLGLGSGKWELGNAAETALSPEATRKTRDDYRAQDLLDLWNASTKPPIPRCRELTETRRRKIRARIAARPSLAEWREAFEAIQATPFYRGENDRQWTADFDWVLKNDTVVAKVLERARTSATRSLEAYEWVCPHQPVCLGRHACSVKSALEKGRAS